MSRLHIKKNQLIAVAGVVWLLAGLNVAILGVRAAIGMRGVAAIVLVAIAGGAVAAFCGFHSMFTNSLKRIPSASTSWKASATIPSASSTAGAT